ncbi:MAG: NAD(P)-dependent oxidoreductase [Bryobacterales bacterium]|nr:NAD(P)-dependent oxidoreductase [Bryobacterales bacterium]
MKPELLIIGASGFVGAELAAQAGGSYQVAAPGPEELDITSASSVERGFAAAQPRVVALVAAIADIDQCEQQPELAWKVNAEGARLVAEACVRYGARLLYISSAAVYDGTKEGYRESDPVTPASVYGRTKAEAERLVLGRLPRSIVLRPALVIGAARTAGTNSFQEKLVSALESGKSVSAPVFESRNPIDAGTLVVAMLRLAANPKTGGIYHVGSAQAVSRYELACRFADLVGAPRSLVIAQTEPAPGRAPRGRHHFLMSSRLEQATGLVMPDIDTVLERALHGFTESNLRVGV